MNIGLFTHQHLKPSAIMPIELRFPPSITHETRFIHNSVEIFSHGFEFAERRYWAKFFSVRSQHGLPIQFMRPLRM